jgi:ribosome-binding protein aMBF1 (putative translation factor)
MEPKKVLRVTNSKRLTPEEAAEARKRRDLVQMDKDEILAEGRAALAEKRKREAAAKATITFGQKIRAAREGRGLSQAELAMRASVSQAHLSFLEQDQREPSLSIAALIARELEISLDELANSVAP